MAVTVTALGARMTAATAATVAAAIGGGTTAAEVTALIKLLTVMGLRPGDTVPLLSLALSNNGAPDVSLTAY